MGRIRHQSRPRSGITLIELLVVMAIAAVVAGMLVASFSAVGRRTSREGAAQDIQSLLRRAQISAVDSGRGALVRIDPVERSIYGLSTSIEGAWHFEHIDGTITPGAKGYDGEVNGGVTQGHGGAVGLSLAFDGDDYIDCGNPPVFNQTDGVRIETWVWPDAPTVATGELLGVMGKSSVNPDAAGYAMGLVCTGTSPERYAPCGGFFLDDDPANTAIMLRAHEDFEIAGQEWSHVAIEFDGYEARLFVNGVLADLDSSRQPEDDNPVADPNPPNPPQNTDVTFVAPQRIRAARGANLTIGAALFPPMGTTVYMQGRIDQPKILSVAGGERTRMPEGVPIFSSHGAIHFDGQGRLDIAYHGGDVFIAVGDPYQMAELAGDVAVDALTLPLQGRNPMPPDGGIVLIRSEDAGEVYYELIRYDSAAGANLNLIQFNDRRAAYGTLADAHDAGDPVWFARVVRVTPAGVVGRVVWP
ncbi:MAG: LamG domain-containing protein [Candidatus Brocadiaceae bacterium]|nr:LamG domain-containing protein [Candidatus Brocadiaceae bacterium]